MKENTDQDVLNLIEKLNSQIEFDDEIKVKFDCYSDHKMWFVANYISQKYPDKVLYRGRFDMRISKKEFLLLLTEHEEYIENLIVTKQWKVFFEKKYFYELEKIVKCIKKLKNYCINEFKNKLESGKMENLISININDFINDDGSSMKSFEDKVYCFGNINEVYKIIGRKMNGSPIFKKIDIVHIVNNITELNECCTPIGE